MAINLEDPKRFRPLRDQVHQVAMNMLRPISRKYDKAEHAYPKELDMLAAMADGLAESGAGEGAAIGGCERASEVIDDIGRAHSDLPFHDGGVTCSDSSVRRRLRAGPR